MKFIIRLFVLSLIVLLGLNKVHAQNGSKPVSMTDMTRIAQLGSIAVSPDGRLIAYTVQTIEADKAKAGEYQYRTHIWMVPFDGSAPARQLTSASTNSTNPQWLEY